MDSQALLAHPFIAADVQRLQTADPPNAGTYTCFAVRMRVSV